MAEPEPKRKAPRFPFVAALLCAACVGAAAWTWMRHSYAWNVGPTALLTREEVAAGECPYPYVGRYVRLRCRIEERSLDEWWYVVSHGPAFLLVRPGEHVEVGDTVVVTGRVKMRMDVGVDAAASRWHGASVSGLVVGAMGVFVFSVALRHWLRRRRTIMALEVP